MLVGHFIPSILTNKTKFLNFIHSEFLQFTGKLKCKKIFDLLAASFVNRRDIVDITSLTGSN